MADPLSVTASIIAVVGAADAVAKGLRRLKAVKDAPQGLQDLILDVAQIEMVLNGVKSVVLDSGSPPIELATLIEEAGSKLLELRSLIEYTLTKAGVSDKVDRWQWLRKGNEVERLRHQLGTIRLNLVTLTSSANFGVLQRVSIVTQDLSSEQQRLNAQMTSVLPRQEALLNHLCQRIEESQATQAAMMRLLGNFRQVDINMASNDTAAFSQSFESATMTPIVARPRMRSRSEFQIQSLQIQSTCPTACTCDCHKTWRIYTPRSLRKLFGYSKIEGAEVPFFKGACSLQSCKGKRATFVNINFFLPTTIAARMISLWFTSSPFYGPELLLRVPRVVRADAPAYRAISDGRLDAVKRSLSAGDFKPWDVDYTGRSLIASALDYGSVTTALYLAQAASDDYECLREDYDVTIISQGETSPRVAFLERKTALSALILGLRLGKVKERPPLELDNVPGVDWTVLCDHNGFSKLHKIVFGVSSQQLDAEIEARPEDLDRPDCIGLTALWYACWLGNSNHVRILIQHGADMNYTSYPPIYAAVWRGSYDLVEQLLDAGAFITDQSMGTLYETLMYLSPRLGEEHVKEMLAIDKALFGRLFSVNHRPSKWIQAPPLIALTGQRSPVSNARIRQLLELGADTELADEEGVTALCHAIYSSNAEGCKILGRAGANANVKTNRGNTILHLAIKNAAVTDTIQAVSELDLSGVELGAKDHYDYTAFELLKIRAGRHRNDQHLFPGLCCYDRDHNRSRCYPYFSWDYGVKNIDMEVQILSSFQALLQQVQEAQGIPMEDRYPLLDLTYESIMIYRNEDGSLKTLPSVPGAWPEN